MPGGEKTVIESPLIQELLTENTCATTREAVLAVLEARFGEVPRDLSEDIQAVVSDKQLRALVRKAALCSDLNVFRKAVRRR
jgi:hypothetical protein